MVPMVGTLNSIYRGEESPPIQGVCARYHRCRPARARSIGGKITESVAQFAEYFRGGARAIIGILSGKHWAVRCRTTVLQSPYRRFRLGHKLQRMVAVMQTVSYSPAL